MGRPQDLHPVIAKSLEQEDASLSRFWTHLGLGRRSLSVPNYEAVPC